MSLFKKASTSTPDKKAKAKKNKKLKINLEEIVKEYRVERQTLQTLKSAFINFDLNKDGHISAKELGKVMKSLGQTPSKQELTTLIKESDIDGNGEIEFPEFVLMMVRKDKAAQEASEVEEAFSLFDKNGDGFISKDELREAMKKIGQKLTETELNEMISAADKDGDGLIDIVGMNN